MTQLVRDASNWAFQLDLQESNCMLDFTFILSRHGNLTNAWFEIGAQQLRADQLRMLDDL
jgi:hypothetical protein